MVALTPERTALLALAALGLWTAHQLPVFEADVAAFRAAANRAAANTTATEKASPAAPPAPVPLVSPLASPLAEPEGLEEPPHPGGAAVLPLVYRLEPDDPPVLPPPVPVVPLTLPPEMARPPSTEQPQLQQSAAFDPAPPDAISTAYAALAAGEDEAALAHFRQALEAAPSGPLAADMGYALLRLGRRREAAQALGHALTLGAPTLEAQRQWRQDYARLTGRFSAETYVFLREENPAVSTVPASLAPLGQSQSALALHFRPDPLAERPLLATARLLAAHNPSDGIPERQTLQATAGLGWNLLPAANATLVGERWIKLGSQSRNAWALRLHGGGGQGYGPLAGERGWPLWSLYGEAALVGLNRRDLFAGSEARAGYGLSLGGQTRITATAALWGTVQHDDATRHRLEAGPSLGLETRVGEIPLHLRLDYRLPLSARPETDPGFAFTIFIGF